MKSALFHSRRRGISLIEAMVVLAVLGIVLAVAAPSFSDLLYRKRVEGIAAELVTDLQLLRSHALMRPSANVEGEGGVRRSLSAVIRIGDRFSSSCYMMYWDRPRADCSCNRRPGSACRNIPDAEIKTVQLPNTNNLTITTPGTPGGQGKFQAGTPSFTPSSFQILISGNRTGSLRVSVDGLGRVSTCTPDGGFANYATCVRE